MVITWTTFDWTSFWIGDQIFSFSPAWEHWVVRYIHNGLHTSTGYYKLVDNLVEEIDYITETY